MSASMTSPKMEGDWGEAFREHAMETSAGSGTAGVESKEDRGLVFVVRHGETPWSRSGRHTGRTDVPLDEEGRLQAVRVGKMLAGCHFDRVLSSPLARALETCKLAGFGETVQVDSDLMEWDYGEYEGRTTVSIRQQRPDWSLWRDGVPSGETPAEVGTRADRVIASLIATGAMTLVFAHGHLLRVLAARWIGLSPQHGARFALDAGALGVLGYERETPVIVRWNEAGKTP